jgi:hemoglobin
MGHDTTPYALLGGADGVRRLAERFYGIMSQDHDLAPIRAMHAEDLAPIVEKLTSFLSGWLGGPRDYFERADSPCIMSVHRKYPIGAAERDQWLHCMQRAMRESGADDALCALLEPAFMRLADGMRSR